MGLVFDDLTLHVLNLSFTRLDFAPFTLICALSSIYDDFDIL